MNRTFVALSLIAWFCLLAGCTRGTGDAAGALSPEAAAAKAEAERTVANNESAGPQDAGSAGSLAAEMEARVNQQRGGPVIPNADGSPPARGGR